MKIDRTTIARIESRSLKHVTLDNAIALAAAIGVAPVHLFVSRNSHDRIFITNVETGDGMNMTCNLARKMGSGD
jgi:hypothetical protein